MLVYVRESINAKRKEDLENNIACLWIDICPDKGKSFLVGTCIDRLIQKLNLTTDSKDFIDVVSNETKEFILLGDFTRNVLNR